MKNCYMKDRREKRVAKWEYSMMQMHTRLKSCVCMCVCVHGSVRSVWLINWLTHTHTHPGSDENDMRERESMPIKAWGCDMVMGPSHSHGGEIQHKPVHTHGHAQASTFTQLIHANDETGANEMEVKLSPSPPLLLPPFNSFLTKSHPVWERKGVWGMRCDFWRIHFQWCSKLNPKLGQGDTLTRPFRRPIGYNGFPFANTHTWLADWQTFLLLFTLCVKEREREGAKDCICGWLFALKCASHELNFH